MTPRPVTLLLLARHGETVDNAAQIMQGQTQGRLSERGLQQAAELAAKLATCRIDAVVSSDLYRSVQTARIVSEPHGLPVQQTPLLRERDWGSFTGRYIPDLKDEPWPQDIESLDSLLERAQRFLQYIMTNYEGQTVLAVGHGIINKAIQAAFFRRPMNQVERMSNCEVRQLRLTVSAEVSMVTAAASAVAASAASAGTSAEVTASTEVTASAASSDAATAE